MGRADHRGGHRQRLRERFLAGGLDGFLDYEVIELLLTLNTPRKDCKESAKTLLKKFHTFQGVIEARPEDLQAVQGVGPANILGLKLVHAAAERYRKQKIVQKDVVKNSTDLLSYLHHSIGNKDREYFAGIFLDAKNRVIAADILFTGTLTSSAVYPREVILKAVRHNAASVIFAHNHPSGDAEPSREDIKTTRKLFFALGYTGITVHEHLIAGKDSFYSFHENGFIEQFKKAFQMENG